MRPAATRTPTAGPGWLPGAGRQGAVDRETLWYDHALGADEPAPAPWVARGEVGDPAPPPPEPVVGLVGRPGDPLPWPRGLWDDARSTPFPQRPTRDGDRPDDPPDDALLRLAAQAVSAVRRDPDDPYNDHRAYASPRCLFPVLVSVVVAGEWHVLDPDRRVVVPTGVAADPAHADGAIALAGRWHAIPAGYGWFRGSLVAIETGILLRHLAALSRLHHVALDLVPPRTGWEGGAPARLWREPERWSPPWLLVPATPAAAEAGPAPLVVVGDHHADAYADLVRVYRSHALGTASGPVASGVSFTGAGAGSWSDVLWRRSAGRMPRGLYGFRVADTPVDLDDAHVLARWAARSAPSPVAAATDGLRLHAVVRDVPGLEPGVHEVVDGQYRHRASAPADALDRFASAYLYGSDELSRNDIERAPLVLVVTSRPRAAVRRAGPGAWTATHVAHGWLAHGLSLAAAARHLVARPVRALDERDVAAALDLDDDEMVGLAVVVSHHAPHGGLQIDLRS